MEISKTITPNEVVKNIPVGWDNAAKLCNAIFPSFKNLTNPAQGMVIGSFLTDTCDEGEWIESENRYEFEEVGQDGIIRISEAGRRVIWNFDSELLDSTGTCFKDFSFDDLREYALNLVSIHKNWGVEK